MQQHEIQNERPSKKVQTATPPTMPDRKHTGQPPATAPVFRPISAAEFASADYQTKYMIKNLLVDGQPMLIGGPKKSLKTSLALALALSIVSGQRFLGKFDVLAKRRVLFCSGENALCELQGTAHRICRTAGIELGSQSGLTICQTLPQLGDLSSVRAFGRFIKDSKSRLVILDPAYLMMPGADVTNIFKQGEMLRRISDICQSLKATLIILHHLRKRLNDLEPADLDDLAYAGFAEFARQWLLISRRQPYDERLCGQHQLWLRAGGSAGHSSLWEVDVHEGRISDPDGRRWEVRARRAGNQTSAKKGSQQPRLSVGLRDF